MNVTLTDYYENLVQKLVKQGRYTDQNEVVRAGLRVLEKIEQLPLSTELHQQWIDEALASGPAEPKTQADWDALKERVLSHLPSAFGGRRRRRLSRSPGNRF
jgi:putative addiction module CopG family antidote